MGWTLPSTGMGRGEVCAISDCLVVDANTLFFNVTKFYATLRLQCIGSQNQMCDMGENWVRCNVHMCEISDSRRQVIW